MTDCANGGVWKEEGASDWFHCDCGAEYWPYALKHKNYGQVGQITNRKALTSRNYHQLVGQHHYGLRPIWPFPFLPKE